MWFFEPGHRLLIQQWLAAYSAMKLARPHIGYCKEHANRLKESGKEPILSMKYGKKADQPEDALSGFRPFVFRTVMVNATGNRTLSGFDAKNQNVDWVQH